MMASLTLPFAMVIHQSPWSPWSTNHHESQYFVDNPGWRWDVFARAGRFCQHKKVISYPSFPDKHIGIYKLANVSQISVVCRSWTMRSSNPAGWDTSNLRYNGVSQVFPPLLLLEDEAGRHHCRLTICRLVEQIQPKNNLMIRLV